MKSKFYFQTFITTVLQTGYKRDKKKRRGREGATCLLTWTTINGSFLTKYGQWTVPKLQNSDLPLQDSFVENKAEQTTTPHVGGGELNPFDYFSFLL